MAILINRATMEQSAGDTNEANTNDFLVLTRDTEAFADFLSLTDAGIPNKHWKIVNDRLVEMAAGEKLIVDQTRLFYSKVNAITAFNVELTEFIERKYNNGQKLTILGHIVRSLRTGNTVRADYFLALFDWVESIISYFYQKKDEIIAAPDESTFQQIVSGLDLQQFHATDPNVIIEVGRGPAYDL